jgi:hypothetical protein
MFGYHTPVRMHPPTQPGDVIGTSGYQCRVRDQQVVMVRVCFESSYACASMRLDATLLTG